MAKDKSKSMDNLGEMEDPMGAEDTSTIDGDGMDTEGKAETATEKGSSGPTKASTIVVTPADVPEIEGLQVGDTVTVTAECSVKKVSGDKYTLNVEVFKPSDVGSSSAPADAGMGAGAPAGGGMAALLGGKGA